VNGFQKPVRGYLSANSRSLGGKINGIADGGKLDAEADVIDKASCFAIG
jgi:hypothetical protein